MVLYDARIDHMSSFLCFIARMMPIQKPTKEQPNHKLNWTIITIVCAAPSASPDLILNETNAACDVLSQ